MNSRQRLQVSLAHCQPDRVCVDFGATFVTGIHVSVLTQLRRAVLGEPDYRVKVNIFNKDGGFVFNTIHNIQGNTPIENILAMFRAIKLLPG